MLANSQDSKNQNAQLKAEESENASSSLMQSKTPPSFSLTATPVQKKGAPIQRKTDDSLVTLDDVDFAKSVLGVAQNPRACSKDQWEAIKNSAKEILKGDEMEDRAKALAIMVGQVSHNKLVERAAQLLTKAFELKEAYFKNGAKALETADQGHSLDRHGPEVTNHALDQRLKTGIAPDGANSPAPGLSTRFVDYETWMETRRLSVLKLQDNIQTTVDELTPYVDEYETAKRTFDDPINAGPGRGPGGQFRVALDQAKDMLQGQVILMNSDSPSDDYVPVTFNGAAANPRESVKLKDSYTVLQEHGRKVGEGYRGMGDPVNNTYANTQKVDSLSQTRTGLEGAAEELAWSNGVPNVSGWKAFQHFPAEVDKVGVR